MSQVNVEFGWGALSSSDLAMCLRPIEKFGNWNSTLCDVLSINCYTILWQCQAP